ncbi:hypothetical protein F4802DRAFT_604171 [Xylaria palmicola]|nr:hypothetical protein F4802DRAFT_604171 [Xylaria palmicola]
MESVVTRCAHCDHCLGTLLNLWTQIGKSYISPASPAADALEICPEGAIRQGQKGTIVDRCQCRSTVGSKCTGSVINHVLHEGQLLLRTSSIRIEDPDSRDTREPVIQRLLSLKNPPTYDAQPEAGYGDDDDSSSFSEHFDFGQTYTGIPNLDRIQNSIDAQREEIARLDTAGYQIVASFNQTVQRIEEETRKLKNEITQVTGDSSDNKTKTKELSDDVLSVKTEIREIKDALHPLVAQSHFKQESSSIRNTIAEFRVEFRDKWEMHEQRLNLLESNLESTRRDLKGFQTSLQSARETAKAALSASSTNTEEELAMDKTYNPSPASAVLAARDIDILTDNITKIGHRASQVESFRMELDLLKGRVQRIEAQTSNSQRHPATNPKRREHQHSYPIDSERRVSVDFGAEDSLNPDIPSAAPKAHTSASASSPTHRPDALLSPQPAKTPRLTAGPGIPRFTKSGAVDKRTLKKRNSKREANTRKAKC